MVIVIWSACPYMDFLMQVAWSKTLKYDASLFVMS